MVLLLLLLVLDCIVLVFFFNESATTEIYTCLHTLSLHDALPIFEDNVMNDVEVEVEVEDSPSMPMEIPGMGGQVGMINLSDMMSKAFGQSQRKRRKMR